MNSEQLIINSLKTLHLTVHCFTMATDERSAVIKIGNEEYKLVLTTRANKEIAKRYGGLENLGNKLMNTKDFELALEEVVWLITLLANQSILIHNLRNKDDKKI